MLKLTIGIPTHHDFSGAMFTIQAIRMYQELSDYEIVVIDNSVDDQYAKALERQTRSMKEVRYIRFRDQHGPAIAKNQVFEHARGEYVICLDSHVILSPGSLNQLIQWFNENQTDDLVTGPLLMNDGGMSTHFKEQWRGEMWGVWGYDAQVEKGEPFEVWANGCGLFACRRESWLGFNPNFRGFGAEEGYLHEKFRKAGAKVLCMPWLGWWHRFDNPEPRRHSVNRYDKVRNYVLGFQELELDLDEVYNHFVSVDVPEEALVQHLVDEHSESGESLGKVPAEQLQLIHRKHKMSVDQWEYLLADPIANEQPMTNDVETYLQRFAPDTGSDLNQHFPTLTQFADQVESIVEVTRRQQSAVPLLAGKPKTMTSFIYEQAPLPWRSVPHTKFRANSAKSFEDIDVLPEAEMLFIKFPHETEGDTVLESLKKWSESTERFIAFHDAAIGYHESINGAVQEFVENSDWFVVHYDHRQWGMVVLGKQEQDRPERQVFAWEPGYGPGTEMKKLLKEMGIEATAKCACNARALQMDLWGADGCEENFDLIVEWLQDGSEQWIAEVIKEDDQEKKVTWADKIKKKISIAKNALLSGVAFKINPLKPYESLVRESIKRCQELAN